MWEIQFYGNQNSAFFFAMILIPSGGLAIEMPLNHLPGVLSDDADPRLVAAVNLATSSIDDEQINGMAQLKEMTNDTVLAPSALLAIALIRGSNKSDESLKLARKSLLECVRVAPEYSSCQVWLGLYLRKGIGGSINLDASFIAFQAATDAGSAIGQWHLAMAYLKGEGGKGDEQKAFKLVEMSARQDYVPALISYGTMKTLSQGTKQDMKAAYNATARAAHFGSPHATYVVAHMLEHGKGVRADRYLADAAYLRAAKLGERNSMILLSNMFETLSAEESEIFFNLAQENEKKLEKTLSSAKLPN